MATVASLSELLLGVAALFLVTSALAAYHYFSKRRAPM